MFKWLVVIVGLLGVITAGLLLLQPSLSSIHKQIVADYGDVRHVSAVELSALSDDSVVVFDVREEGEFAVSHLANAIHISPDTDVQEFIEDYGDVIADKKAVFYCSVGRRSSGFIRDLNNAKASFSMVNLEGGLFNWVNQQRQIEGGGIHPYNAYWGRLVKDKTQIQYQKTHTKNEQQR